MHINYKKYGFYTIEGAFTIIVFTSLFMMLLSLVTLVKLESVVQTALNETAMQISQYSYGIVKFDRITGNNRLIDDENRTVMSDLLVIVKDGDNSKVGVSLGAQLCEQLVATNLNVKDYDDWLLKQGVVGGYDGISFADSNILSQGDGVSVVAKYTVKLNTFGLLNKEINISQRADTRAWLPIGAEKLYESLNRDNGSIWSQDPLIRGKYFVSQIKAEYKDEAISSGQGVDLFFKSDRRVVEIFSMNLFDSTYSSVENGQADKSTQYKPNDENITKQLEQYAIKFENDLESCERIFQMENGRLSNYGSLNKKEIWLVVPIEVQDMNEFKGELKAQKALLKREYGIDLVIEYREGAFL